MNNKRRIFLARKYGRLYKRTYQFDLDKCAYCNDPRVLLDHVPPISMLENIDVRLYLKKGGKLLLYPCCKTCNATLGGKQLITYQERLEYLSTRYIAKLDNMEVWDEGELSEMGHSMRTFIESRQSKVRDYVRKLQAVEDKLLEIDNFDEYEGSLRVNRSDNSATG